MSSQTWLEKAERLRSELARLRAAQPPPVADPDLDGEEALERVAIAQWLRSEFSDEPPEDTATLALFPDIRGRA